MPLIACPVTRPVSFTDAERRHLLASPGLGPVVVQRLETIGVTSLASLRQQGVDGVIDLLCASAGHRVWRNRRRALARALAAYP